LVFFFLEYAHYIQGGMIPFAVGSNFERALWPPTTNKKLRTRLRNHLPWSKVPPHFNVFPNVVHWHPHALTTLIQNKPIPRLYLFISMVNFFTLILIWNIVIFLGLCSTSPIILRTGSTHLNSGEVTHISTKQSCSSTIMLSSFLTGYNKSLFCKSKLHAQITVNSYCTTSPHCYSLVWVILSTTLVSEMLSLSAWIFPMFC
jgi:hypothetical protein